MSFINHCLTYLLVLFIIIGGFIVNMLIHNPVAHAHACMICDADGLVKYLVFLELLLGLGILRMLKKLKNTSY